MNPGASRDRARGLVRGGLALAATGIGAARALPGTAELPWIGAAATFPPGGVPPVPPLLPFLLAPFLRGVGGAAGLALARGVAAVLAAAALLAAARLARRRAGDGAGRAVLVAALALAVIPGSPFPSALAGISPAGLAALLAVLVASLLYRARERRFPDGLLALAGASCGLLALAAGVSWLAGALAAAAWAGARGAKGAWVGLSGRRAAALVLVPAVFVLLPVSLWNVFGARDPVVICREGPLGAFLAAEPGLGPAPGAWPREPLEVRLDPVPGLLGRDRAADHRRFFLRHWVAGWIAEPGRRAAHLLRAAVEYVRPVPLDDAGQGASPPGPAARWGLALLLGFLFTGTALGLRRGDPVPVLGIGLALPALLAGPPAEASRGPLFLLVLSLGCAGWAGILRRGRVVPARQLLVAAVAAGILPLAVAPRPAPAPLAGSLRRALGLLAARAAGGEDGRERVRSLVLAGLAGGRNDPRACWYGIRAAERVGAWEVAARSARRLAADRALHPAWRQDARLVLARILAGQGDEAGALAAWEDFLAEAHAPEGSDVGIPLPGTPPVTACLARLERAELLARLGRRGEAVADLVRVGADCGTVGGLAHRARELLLGLGGEADQGSTGTGLPPG